jgi:hypothetical protein
MSTEDEKQLRQVLRMAHQLPEPDWNLLARTSKRFSRAGQELKGIDVQKMVGKPRRKYTKKIDDQTGKDKQK